MFAHLNNTRLPICEFSASETGVSLPRNWYWGLVETNQVSETAYTMTIVPVRVNHMGRCRIMAAPVVVPYDGRRVRDPYAPA